jgi:cytochrome c-type biogenesis protein CcmF
MENLGSLAILLAFCLALYATAACVIGRLKNKPFLIVSGERAVYGIWALDHHGVRHPGLLADHQRLPFRLRGRALQPHDADAVQVCGVVGRQEGSLLLWSFLLATYSSVVVFTNRRKHRDMMPWVIEVLTTIQSFFLVLNNFIANPFQMLAVDKLITSVPDGNGLSPLLQYPAMAIHPPMLYLGYVGFSVPFAFAIGSLITRQPGDAWIFTTRRWTLVTWLFQSTGVMLGAAWAYHVLGWGGYWGWDPVENASLLPWLSGTAFLHSVMMQEKKGMMKIWNIVLVSATFFLCILGTLLTRSRIVQSVHAFAPAISAHIGFLVGLGIAAVIFLILDRLDYLKSEAQLESVISRESSFLFNNLILLASCFAVLWGTLFPVISEAISGDKISLDADWYNRLIVQIGLFLLFLTGVGPLFAGGARRQRACGATSSIRGSLRWCWWARRSQRVCGTSMR